MCLIKNPVLLTPDIKRQMTQIWHVTQTFTFAIKFLKYEYVACTRSAFKVEVELKVEYLVGEGEGVKRVDSASTVAGTKQYVSSTSLGCGQKENKRIYYVNQRHCRHRK
jgi:hypothetical protein